MYTEEFFTEQFMNLRNTIDTFLSKAPREIDMDDVFDDTGKTAEIACDIYKTALKLQQLLYDFDVWH